MARLLYKFFSVVGAGTTNIVNRLILINFAFLFINYRMFRHESRESDLFISAYPKAGATVLQMMLYQMISNGDLKIKHISKKIPWFEETIVTNPQVIDEMSNPRIFKTHLLYRYLPKKGKIIYIVRNIKDTNLSYFQHLISNSYFMQEDLASFTRKFVKGKVIHGGWVKHLKSWWPHRNDKRVLFLTYDELIDDMHQVVLKVNQFCQFNLDAEKLEQVTKKCHIDFMRKHNHLFDPRLSVCHRRDQEEYATTFINKGEAGRWKKIYTTEQNQLLSHETEMLIKKLDIDPDSTEARFLKWK